MNRFKEKLIKVSKEMGFPIFMTVFFVYGNLFSIQFGITSLVFFFFFSLGISFAHDYIKDKLGEEKYTQFCKKAPKVALIVIVFLFCFGVFYQNFAKNPFLQVGDESEKYCNLQYKKIKS